MSNRRRRNKGQPNQQDPQNEPNQPDDDPIVVEPPHQEVVEGTREEELARLVERLPDWATGLYEMGDHAMRWFIVVPIMFSLAIFTIAEATGFEALLWILLVILIAKAAFIALSWPFLITVLIRIPITRPGPQILIIWFLLELLIISAGFLVPFHILNPPFLRVVRCCSCLRLWRSCTTSWYRAMQRPT